MALYLLKKSLSRSSVFGAIQVIVINRERELPTRIVGYVLSMDQRYPWTSYVLSAFLATYRVVMKYLSVFG